jgi:hypothetical protein
MRCPQTWLRPGHLRRVATSRSGSLPGRQRLDDSIESVVRTTDRLFMEPGVKPLRRRQEITGDGSEHLSLPGLPCSRGGTGPSLEVRRLGRPQRQFSPRCDPPPAGGVKLRQQDRTAQSAIRQASQGQTAGQRPLGSYSRGPVNLQSPAQQRHTVLARDQKRRHGRPQLWSWPSWLQRAARIEAQRTLPGRKNFDTYLTQRAAGSRLQPVSAGHPIRRAGCRASRDRSRQRGMRPVQSQEEHVRAGVGYHAASHPPV